MTDVDSGSVRRESGPSFPGDRKQEQETLGKRSVVGPSNTFPTFSLVQ